MPTSTLAYRKVVESYMKSQQRTNQSVTKPPIGPPNPKPSCGGVEVLADTRLEGTCNITPLNMLATPWAKPRL